MQIFTNIQYEINKDQYLSEIEPFKSNGIPTNIFLWKKLPGLGATEREITFPRNSIIMEVNVPVIAGKCLKNKAILGVYEGVTIDMVRTYLLNETKYKKLLVTPESFYKIKEAVDGLELDLYKDFFLLFDECEKIIQDVNFRNDIVLPIDDFFQFTNKAFVSATPILPSDPRFKKHKFSIAEIVPKFDYSQPLTLITTNNIFISLAKFLQENQRESYFIFFNTTENIADFIKKNEIEGESLVFCAKDSSKKLKANGFKNVSTSITTFKRYNFFTSRFYSAVDIDYELYRCNPTIIMVTDVIFALHSKVDPLTEAIQIPGRFRKPIDIEVAREIIHITNVDSDLTSMNRNEVCNYLKESHIVYNAIDRYYEASTSLIAKETLRQMLTRIDYAKFINSQGLRDHFMVDNMINDEKVKKYYQDSNNLIAAYTESQHFKLEPVHTEIYTYTDKDRLKVRPKDLPLKDLKKILSERLIELHQLKPVISDFAFHMELTNLQFDFPDQMIPINKYGIDNSFKLKFDISAIEQALIKSKVDKDFFGMMTYIQNKFRCGKVYESDQIIDILKSGLNLTKIYGVKPTINYLRKYAELSDRKNRVLIRKDSNGKEIRGYKIIKFKN